MIHDDRHGPVPARRREPTPDPHMVRVVEGFVTWLKAVEGEDARVDSWPDQDPRGNPTCDAILMRDGVRVDVEHTRVHHGDDEARLRSLFERVRPELARELRTRQPDRASWIAIPIDGLDKRRLRSGWVARLADACAPAIGRLEPDASEAVSFDGLPAPVVIRRRAATVDPGLHLAFPIAPDEPAERQARKQVEEAVRRKAQKHGGPGAPMILLLDSELSPVPLMHVPGFADAGLMPESGVFHELWLAGSGADPAAFVGPIRHGSRRDPGALFEAALAAWNRMRGR